MEFGIKEILIWIVVGGIAGWLADLVVRGITSGCWARSWSACSVACWPADPDPGWD